MKNISVIVNDIDEAVTNIDKLHGYKNIHSVCDVVKSFFDNKYSSDIDGAECTNYQNIEFAGCALDEHKYYNDGIIDSDILKEENKRGITTIEKKVKESLSKGNIPLVIGGSHGVSYNTVKTVKEHINEDIGLVYFDSHNDCGEQCEYNPGTVDRCSWVKKLIDDRIIKAENILFISNNPQILNEETYCTEKGSIYINESEREHDNNSDVIDRMYSSLETLSKKVNNIYVSYDRDYNNKEGVAIPAYSESESVYPKIDAIKEAGGNIIGVDIQEYFPPNEKTIVGLFGIYPSTRRSLYNNIYDIIQRIR